MKIHTPHALVKVKNMSTSRQTDHPVDSVFLQRWSPRAFDESSLPKKDLLTMLEAARWAPSAFNIQPWRFFYSLRGDQNWQRYLDLLDPFNASWAQSASALVFLASDTLVDLEGEDSPRPAGYHGFDAGSAWTQLALQATLMGYSTHAAAGLYKDKAAEELNLPDRFHVQVAIAIGRKGDTQSLSEELQEREKPSSRLSLQEIAFEGGWPHA